MCTSTHLTHFSSFDWLLCVSSQKMLLCQRRCQPWCYRQERWHRCLRSGLPSRLLCCNRLSSTPTLRQPLLLIYCCCDAPTGCSASSTSWLLNLYVYWGSLPPFALAWLLEGLRRHRSMHLDGQSSPFWPCWWPNRSPFLCARYSQNWKGSRWSALIPSLLLFITPAELSFEKQCKYVNCSASSALSRTVLFLI
jgi:hypothetical protein